MTQDSVSSGPEHIEQGSQWMRGESVPRDAGSVEDGLIFSSDGQTYRSFSEAYMAWYDQRPPEVVAQMQEDWKKHVAYIQSPEGQAESKRLREAYASLPEPGGRAPRTEPPASSADTLNRPL